MEKSKRLKRRTHFVCEAGGFITFGFVNFMHSKRKRISCIPPVRIREFAKSQGFYAKTDPLDAKIIAVYGETIRPRPDPKPVRRQTEFLEIMR